MGSCGNRRDQVDSMAGGLFIWEIDHLDRVKVADIIAAADIQMCPIPITGIARVDSDLNFL